MRPLYIWILVAITWGYIGGGMYQKYTPKPEQPSKSKPAITKLAYFAGFTH